MSISLTQVRRCKAQSDESGRRVFGTSVKSADTHLRNFSSANSHAASNAIDTISYAPSLCSSADIQLHSWGATVEEALENCVICMFGYMTDLNTVRDERDVQGQKEDKPGVAESEFGGREQTIKCSR